MEWFYLKLGNCNECGLDDVRLYCPRIPGARIILAPNVCAKCRDKYIAGFAGKVACPKCLMKLDGNARCPTCEGKD